MIIQWLPYFCALSIGYVATSYILRLVDNIIHEGICLHIKINYMSFEIEKMRD